MSIESQIKSTQNKIDALQGQLDLAIAQIRAHFEGRMTAYQETLKELTEAQAKIDGDISTVIEGQTQRP
jgi:flagellar capping protein FliD